MKTFIIPGNHDCISHPNKKHNLELAMEIKYKNIEFIDEVVLEEVWGKGFLFIPHMTTSRVKRDFGKEFTPQSYINHKVEELLNSTHYDEIIVFSHLDISGAELSSGYKMKGESLALPDILKENKKIKAIFNGHIHKPQKIKNKANYTYIVGSTEINNFGELNDKKCYITFDFQEDK